jgi:5-methylcytosine-specific restriction enzyme A
MRRLCGCGCGEWFETTKYFGAMRKKYGEYPRFKTGHVNRLPEYKERITGRPAVVQKWLIANQGKFICKCGCGEPIILHRDYHSKGVPHYRHRHHPNSGQNFTKQMKVNAVRQKFLKLERKTILIRAKYRCVRCGYGDRFKKAELEIDHIIPLSKGGKTEIGNAQVLCKPCHLKKTHQWDNRRKSTHKGGKFRGTL